MTTDRGVVVAVPGDLHLTEAGRPNHAVARWAVGEINALVRPDFVQFIGDNVQDGTPEQFALFRELAGRLRVPWYALVGDHDAPGDRLPPRSGSTSASRPGRCRPAGSGSSG